MSSHNERKNQLFWNKGKDSIRITYLRFQSCVHPREWDSEGDFNTQHLLGTDEMFYLKIRGAGEVFIKWRTDTGERADHFTVQFDPDGAPYPYIFGGDKWTMALRHAALRAIAENGDT